MGNLEKKPAQRGSASLELDPGEEVSAIIQAGTKTETSRGHANI